METLVVVSLQNSFVLVSLISAFLFVGYFAINEVIRFHARNKEFGGPPNRLLVGNLPDISVNAPEVFRHLAKTYGDVFQIQLGNVPILVVNSAAAAKELFGRHSHELSSRPVFYTFHKIVAKTAGSTIGTSPISDSLKRRRRAAASALNKPAVASYVSYLDLETKTLIKGLYDSGEGGEKAVNPMPLIQRFALSMSLTVNWGTRMASHDDDLFREIIEVERGIVSTRNRTQNLADYIPLLRWIPFATNSRKARDWRVRRDAYLAKFDRDLRAQVNEGTHQPSIQANAMLDDEAKLSKDELTSVSISIIQGGTDTVAGTVNWSIAFLAQRPDIQKRALAEIRKLHNDDNVLCDVADDMRCTYVAAMTRECLRYFTVLRLSLPRETIEDVVYEGRRIPKGSTIWLNAWACNMDPAVWKDPFEFRPERWIEQPDAPLFTYGLGYRMCAGYNLANRELYLLLMRVISCYEIVAATKVDVNPTTGSSHVSEGGRSPRPYEVYFKPRDDTAMQKVTGEEEARLSA